MQITMRIFGLMHQHFPASSVSVRFTKFNILSILTFKERFKRNKIPVVR